MCASVGQWYFCNRSVVICSNSTFLYILNIGRQSTCHTVTLSILYSNVQVTVIYIYAIYLSSGFLKHQKYMVKTKYIHNIHLNPGKSRHILHENMMLIIEDNIVLIVYVCLGIVYFNR